MKRREVDFDRFLRWAEDRFGDDMRVSDGKVRINSIFTDDQKHHLYCKPSINHYRCFKSGVHGSLFDLVMRIDHVPFHRAVDLLGGEPDIGYLESQLEEYLTDPVESDSKPPPNAPPRLTLPPGTLLVDAMPDGEVKQDVLAYLAGRKLPSAGLYYCASGKYRRRLIIPYYDSRRTLIWWNGRDVSGESKIRYMAPGEEFGVRKTDQVFMWTQPARGQKVYVTEGEFDALTLAHLGFHAAAFGGKDASAGQWAKLFEYRIVLAFDADSAGREAFCAYVLEQNVYPFGGLTGIVTPPPPHKDWNSALQSLDPAVLRAYILGAEEWLPWDVVLQRFRL